MTVWHPKGEHKHYVRRASLKGNYKVKGIVEALRNCMADHKSDYHR